LRRNTLSGSYRVFSSTLGRDAPVHVGRGLRADRPLRFSVAISALADRHRARWGIVSRIGALSARSGRIRRSPCSIAPAWQTANAMTGRPSDHVVIRTATLSSSGAASAQSRYRSSASRARLIGYVSTGCRLKSNAVTMPKFRRPRDAPVEIRILVGARADASPGGGDDFDRRDVVGGETVLPHQPPVTAAERRRRRRWTRRCRPSWPVHEPRNRVELVPGQAR
jgi:hypothetical protein